MKTRQILLLVLVTSVMSCGTKNSCDVDGADESTCKSIYVGPELSCGCGLGVDSSERDRDWLTDMHGFMGMSYPSGQTWGAVFITVGGDPVAPPRPSADFSHCRRLSVDLRGKAGGEMLQIGIKDNTDPDDGTETKIPVRCSSSWTSYEFELADFDTADLKRLYLVCEFVFAGPKAQTVYFRNVRYLR